MKSSFGSLSVHNYLAVHVSGVSGFHGTRVSAELA